MNGYVLGAILAMAAVTILCRAAPFLFFMKRRPPAVVDFLQGATLLLGFFGAAAFTRRLGARPWAQLTPQLVGISLVTAELWYLIV